MEEGWNYINKETPKSPEKNLSQCQFVRLSSKTQGDQKVSVHLMITIQKVTSNVRSVSRQSLLTRRNRLTLTPIPIMLIWKVIETV
jgi:hypothetical protein